MNGTVKFFNTAKGIGFVAPDGGRSLSEGDRVSFALEDDRKERGKQAAQLKKL